MKEVRIGLIGYGMSGSVSPAPLISSVPGLNLHTVVSKNSAKVHQAFPMVKVVADVEALLADADIDTKL
jgi:scyllo-inositol 2-dehydrogenase (NADP+)